MENADNLYDIIIDVNTPGYFEDSLKEIQQIDHNREIAAKLLNDLDIDIDL